MVNRKIRTRVLAINPKLLLLIIYVNKLKTVFKYTFNILISE